MSQDPAASASLHERTVPGLQEHLCERLSAIDRAPVLDIGCGTGAWLARLARAGFVDLHGVVRPEVVILPTTPDVQSLAARPRFLLTTVGSLCLLPRASQ